MIPFADWQQSIPHKCEGEEKATVRNTFDVYLLRSIPNPMQTYIGITEDLKTRVVPENSYSLKSLTFQF